MRVFACLHPQCVVLTLCLLKSNLKHGKEEASQHRSVMPILMSHLRTCACKLCNSTHIRFPAVLVILTQA